jgi:uncharacterized protein YqfB (UPF0267 family)
MIDLSSEELEAIRKTIEIAWDSGGNFCPLDLLLKLGFVETDFIFIKIKEEILEEIKLNKFKSEQEEKLKKLLLKK